MTDRLINYLVARAGKEYGAGFRAVMTVLGGTLFLVGWPALVYLFAAIFNQQVFSAPISYLLSVLFFIVGVPWMLWAILWQLSRGKGTPVPIVPTKEFLATGPYRFVRNPMITGHFFYLLGFASFFNAVGGYTFSALFFALMIAEIKGIEERELVKRFGEAYIQYKKETPFMIPCFCVKIKCGESTCKKQ
jgi:protein-S-isoprenylcysteine O-methyltransferase Ste14